MLDDVLLDLHPYEAIKQGRSQDKSIMVGHTTGEGATFVYAIFRTQMNQVFYKVLVDNWYHGNETIIEKILERYPPCRATDRTCDNRKDVSEIVSESLFFCPLRDMMKNRAAFTLERQIPNLAEPTRFLPGKTFRYIFDHPSAIVPEIQNITICEQISCHTAELPLIFQTFKELGWSPTIPELNLSRKMIGYWTNFAWSNNPNSAPHEYHEDNKYAENLPCWPQFLNNPEFNQACQDDPEKFYKSMYLKTEEFDQHITPDEIDANCDFWDSLDLYLKY